MKKIRLNLNKRVAISVIIFLFALCLTELSPFSSKAVGTYNGGYGTFDMKTYDAQIYQEVMNNTTNNDIYWKYYMVDFIFVIAFFNFMIQLTRSFTTERSTRIKKVAYIFAAIRGLLDIVENILLLYAIYEFPKASTSIIEISNTITRSKFVFMRGWLVCFAFLVILQIYQSRKRKTK